MLARRRSEVVQGGRGTANRDSASREQLTGELVLPRRLGPDPESVDASAGTNKHARLRPLPQQLPAQAAAVRLFDGEMAALARAPSDASEAGEVGCRRARNHGSSQDRRTIGEDRR